MTDPAHVSFGDASLRYYADIFGKTLVSNKRSCIGELLPNCCLVKPSEESPGAGLTRRPFPRPFTPSGPFRRRCRKHQSFSLRWNKRNIFCLSAKLERPGVALCKHRLFAVTAGMTVGKSILFFSLPDAPAPHGAGPARPPEHLEARPRTRGAVPSQPSGREAGSASVVLLWLPVRRGWPGCQHRNRGGRLAPSFAAYWSPGYTGVSAPLLPTEEIAMVPVLPDGRNLGLCATPAPRPSGFSRAVLWVPRGPFGLGRVPGSLGERWRHSAHLVIS